MLHAIREFDIENQFVLGVLVWTIFYHYSYVLAIATHAAIYIGYVGKHLLLFEYLLLFVYIVCLQ